MDIAYLKASDQSGEAVLANIEANRSVSATTLDVDSVDNWPDYFIFATGDKVLASDGVSYYIDPATMTIMYGHLDSGDIIIDGYAPGYSDAGNTSGQIAIIKPNTFWTDEAVKRMTPPGAVIPYAGSTAPEGWLLCNGAAVSRTTYAALFDLIGTTFGVGDGSTTFNVPDMRSKMPIGVGAGTWTFEFDSTDVNTSTDEITVTANDGFRDGRAITLTTTGTLPTGLSLATTYYIIVVDSTTIKLATSRTNALLGTAINITAQGSGTNTGTEPLTERTLGEEGGIEMHTHALSNSRAGVPFALDSSTTWIKRDGPNFGQNSTNNQTGVTWGGTSTGISTSLGLYGDTSEADELFPPFLALNYLIKI